MPDPPDAPSVKFVITPKLGDTATLVVVASTFSTLIVIVPGDDVTGVGELESVTVNVNVSCPVNPVADVYVTAPDDALNPVNVPP